MTKNDSKISFIGNLWWADSIKMIRKDKKLTLNDLGSMTGMKESYLSRIENGKHDIKISTFEKIVESYGYEISIVPKEEE